MPSAKIAYCRLAPFPSDWNGVMNSRPFTITLEIAPARYGEAVMRMPFASTGTLMSVLRTDARRPPHHEHSGARLRDCPVSSVPHYLSYAFVVAGVEGEAAATMSGRARTEPCPPRC
jgi:hypothetical protein